MAGEVEPRPELRDLAPCPHGAIGEAELAALGLRPEDVIDFSVNCNPLGPSPRVREALLTADVARYPDDEANALRQAIAASAGLSPEQVLVGNGSAELIWLVAVAYLRPDDRVLVLGPTFGEYARACRVMGVEPMSLNARPEDGFAPDLVTAKTMLRARPRLAFLCNPNNPTGTYLSRGQIEDLLAVGQQTLFVIDEAYRTFVEEPWLSDDLATRGNVVLLRSLTKDHALAGLRLGYAAASREVIDALRSVRPPWSVNALAQAAGRAALADAAHLAASRAEVFAAKRYLVEALTDLGWRVHAGSANFLLVEVGDARTLRQALLRRGCCVRDCTSFGLPQYVRIGVRTRPECQRLVEAFVWAMGQRGLGPAASAPEQGGSSSETLSPCAGGRVTSGDEGDRSGQATLGEHASTRDGREHTGERVV